MILGGTSFFINYFKGQMVLGVGGTSFLPTAFRGTSVFYQLFLGEQVFTNWF